MEGRYLITTDAWFIAPDGNQYRAAWGTVKILGDSILGLKTNRGSANWFAQVGGDGMEIIIAGCQIHYAVRSEEAPDFDNKIMEIEHLGELNIAKMNNTRIYQAELI